MQQLQQDETVSPKPTTGSVLVSFCADMLSWSHAGQYMIDQLHLDGKLCPHCGTEITDEARLIRWYLTERIQCSSCRHFFTSLTNTVLHGSTLDPREFYLLKALLELNVDVDLIASVIAVNKETVKRWKKRLYPECISA